MNKLKRENTSIESIQKTSFLKSLFLLFTGLLVTTNLSAQITFTTSQASAPRNALGTTPDDGTGDSLRVAGQKINDNFAELDTPLKLADIFEVERDGNQDITKTIWKDVYILEPDHCIVVDEKSWMGSPSIFIL